MAARKLSPGSQSKLEVKLSPRQIDLRKFAESNEFAYFPQKIRTSLKYKDFPIQKGNKIQYEENILAKYLELGKIEVSDITLQEGALQERFDISITIVQLTETGMTIPDFALEPEGLWSKMFESVSGKDIDFTAHPDFSKKYYLRGEQEESVREFFSESLIHFLENREEMHIECHKNKLLFYKKRDTLEAAEIQYVISFVEDMLKVLNEKTAQPA